MKGATKKLCRNYENELAKNIPTLQMQKQDKYYIQLTGYCATEKNKKVNIKLQKRIKSIPIM